MGSNEGSRWRRFATDAEWQNYRRYARRRGPIFALCAPVRLAVSVLGWVLRRAVDDALWRWRKRTARSPYDGTAELRARPGYLFAANEVADLRAYASSNFGAEVQDLRRSADAILGNAFGWPEAGELCFGSAVQWRGPFADVEQLFWLNRWYFGVTLAKSYVYAGSSVYAHHFIELLEQWSAANPMDPSSPAWESYSVGERIVNWIFADRLLATSNLYRSRGAPLLRSQLEIHADYLLEHLEDRNVHNHLINNARALYTYGEACPELARAAEARSVGWSLLERELRLQFRSDGMLGEQSTHYHLLLLARYVETTLLAQRSGRTLPEWWLERIRRMFVVGNLFVRPDQTLVTVGDVSPDALPQALVGILAIGSALFGVPSHARLTENALWMLGPTALASLTLRGLRAGTHLLEESGYAIHVAPQVHAVIRCDPLATVVRHGHQDPLSVDLWIDGMWLIGDPGNSSFNHDIWEDYFRGPYGHSTVVVDGLPPYVKSATTRGVLPQAYSQATAYLRQGVDDAGRVTIAAGHTGYARLSPPVTLEREIKFDTVSSIIITDQVRSVGKHLVEFLFQLGSNSAALSVDGNVVELTDKDGRNVGRLTFSSTTPVRLERRSGTDETERGGWYSPAYGVRHQATTIVCSAIVDGVLCLETRVERLS